MKQSCQCNSGNKHNFKTAVILIITAVICCMILLSLTASLIFIPKAQAETVCKWARIVSENVPLYADESCNKTVFLLEKSYYVEILEELDKTYLVAVMQNEAGFPQIVGYVRKIESERCTVAPLTPYYPTVKLLVTADSAQLKLSPLPSAENVIAAINTQSLSYYGKVNNYGITWYYVYYGGKFGYVESDSVSAPQISLHPTPIEKDKPTIKPQEPETPDGEDNEKGFSPASEILLIVFVALLAVGLTLALFLPGNVGKKQSVFDTDI